MTTFLRCYSKYHRELIGGKVRTNVEKPVNQDSSF